MFGLWSQMNAIPEFKPFRWTVLKPNLWTINAFEFLMILFFTDFSDALSSALSALYAKIIVILGVALPITEILTSRIPKNIYTGFYLYLYTVSIAFVVFVYTAHVRNRAVFSLLKTYRKWNLKKCSNKRKIFRSITMTFLFFSRWKDKQRIHSEYFLFKFNRVIEFKVSSKVSPLGCYSRHYEIIGRLNREIDLRKISDEEKSSAFWKFLSASWCHIIWNRNDGLFRSRIWAILWNEQWVQLIDQT